MKRIALAALLLLLAGQAKPVKAQDISTAAAVNKSSQTVVWPDYKKDWEIITEVFTLLAEVTNKNSDYKPITAYLISIGVQQGWADNSKNLTRVIFELSVLGNDSVCRVLNVNLPGIGFQAIAVQFKKENGQWMDVASVPRFIVINDYLEDKKLKGVRMVADPIDPKMPPVEILLENKQGP